MMEGRAYDIEGTKMDKLNMIENECVYSEKLHWVTIQ